MQDFRGYTRHSYLLYFQGASDYEVDDEDDDDDDDDEDR